MAVSVEHRAVLRRTLKFVTALVGTFLSVAVIILISRWPFNQSRVKAGLEKSFHGRVEIETYQKVYWPEPGFIARGLVLHRTEDPAVAPLASADSVIVAARWSNLLLLQHRVRLIEIEGLKVDIPASGTEARREDFPPGDGKEFSGPRTMLEVLHLHGSTLKVGTSGEPWVMPVPDLLLEHVVKDHDALFNVNVLLPKPAAAIHAVGSIGPLHSRHLADLPVSADFTVSHLTFENIGNLKGTLDGHGSFHGVLSAIDLTGQAETRNFGIGKGRPTAATASVTARVNGLNGDTELRSIDAHTGATTVHASGTVEGKPKLTLMQISIDRGRVQDVVRPFLAAESAVAGDVRGTSSLRVTPGGNGRKFLDRLSMDAHMTLSDEKFTRRSMEESLSAFSRRAMGASTTSAEARPAPPSAGEPDVMLAAKGAAQLRGGVAHTSNLTALFPGAEIHLGGTYDFHTSTVHMTGNLTMKSDISHVTTGFKSLLLKPLSPFFRHHNGPEGAPAVTVVPIAVTGTKVFKVSGNLLGRK